MAIRSLLLDPSS